MQRAVRFRLSFQFWYHADAPFRSSLDVPERSRADHSRGTRVAVSRSDGISIFVRRPRESYQICRACSPDPSIQCRSSRSLPSTIVISDPRSSSGTWTRRPVLGWNSVTAPGDCLGRTAKIASIASSTTNKRSDLGYWLADSPADVRVRTVIRRALKSTNTFGCPVPSRSIHALDGCESGSNCTTDVAVA